MSTKLNAGRMTVALAWHFDWQHNTMMPEWTVDGGQADLVFISPSGYLTEVEIKCAYSDWEADLYKAKWRQPRPHVARFFYAVTPQLAERVPTWLQPEWGLLVVHPARYDYVKVLREAVRRPNALKVPPTTVAHMHARSYVRYWVKELRTRGRGR